MNKPQYDIDEAWVQRYLEGKLSEEEQNWLKANPFEAEALEGLAEVPNWQQDIASLQRQLQERTHQRATLWVTYGRYAAAVAVLLTTSWLIYRTTLTEAPVEQLSYEVQSDASAAPEEAPIALVIPKKVEGEKATSVVSNPLLSQPNQEIKPVLVPEQETIALLEPAATPAMPEIMADEETADVLEEEVNRIDAEPALSHDYQTRAKQSRFTEPADKFGHQIARHQVTGQISNRQIIGSVYSLEDRMPIPGANVHVKGTIVNTITDVNGQFQVIVPDSSSELVVSSIGYQSEEIAINQHGSLAVQLEEDTQALSEVVIVGYGTQGKKSTLSQPAQPLPSQKAFRTYLQENLQYPEKAQQQGIEGNVKVQFTVKADGELTDFTIKKSLGYGCDEEAIRLIQAGLGWQPALQEGKLQDQKVMVKVRFRLPNK
ncbi:energy transducer TonB [Tunicatimonas pelagia]|uniref:energy transducer TonB n=1 Tax=Tunicatimonas pelagia TaxID=931531 RepID=UPI002666FD47|nr:TonB family protein [Tunicatimonas pelagia]WKN45510.1 TonB family protein [Tunicatimonas pelagia]